MTATTKSTTAAKAKKKNMQINKQTNEGNNMKTSMQEWPKIVTGYFRYRKSLKLVFLFLNRIKFISKQNSTTEKLNTERSTSDITRNSVAV